MGHISEKPNKKYKVSYAVLRKRLEVFWTNLLAVRFFFTKVFKVDPIQEQFDQKGVHYNEAGSKESGTLSLPYQVDIPLKENHAQTRLRVSWMTCCVSDLRGRGGQLPLEQMFKGKTERVLRGLRVPDPARFTLQYAEYGSYRTEHVLRYLERHLLPWTEERRLKNDWRILGLDAYEAHKAQSIRDLAWSRGYISAPGLMIPGGATGIVQGPDTDLHAWLQHELVAMQEMEQTARLLERPGKVPTETRQSMCDYAVCLWGLADHTQGEASFKRNGCSNDLQGKEDKLISRTAREMWWAIGMPDIRRRLEVEVDLFIAGLDDPRPEHVFQLILNYEDASTTMGQEREGEEMFGADLGDDDDDDGGDSSPDGGSGDDGFDEGVPAHGGGASVPQAPNTGDGPSQVGASMAEGQLKGDKEHSLRTDMSRIEVMLAVAKKMDDPAILGALRAQREKLLRAIRRSDAAIVAAAADFRQEAKKDLKKLQEVAKLEDAALKNMKHVQHFMRARGRGRGRGRGHRKEIVVPAPLTDKASEPHVHPPLCGASTSSGGGAPPADIAGAHPLPPGECTGETAGGGAPLTDGLGHYPPEAASIAAAPAGLGPSEDDGAKDAIADKKDKKHKKDKKDKKHKKKKDKKAKDKKHKKDEKASGLPKTVLSVEVDTEARLRTMLQRLAESWAADDREVVIRWLARDIRSKIARARKCSKKFSPWFKYLGRALHHSEMTPGAAERLVCLRILAFSPAARQTVFELARARMLASEAPKNSTRAT